LFLVLVLVSCAGVQSIGIKIELRKIVCFNNGINNQVLKITYQIGKKYQETFKLLFNQVVKNNTI